MSVYVDFPLWKFGRMVMCHMMADTIEELHDMAERLGLRRAWFQNGKHPHYDICKAKRAEAVRLGAKEVTTKELLRKKPC